jgi:hypothetical protein
VPAPKPEGQYLRALRRQAAEAAVELGRLREENQRLRTGALTNAQPSDADAIRAQVRAEEAQARQQEAFTEACNRTYQAGMKEYGPQFQQSVDTLMDAFRTQLQQRPDIFEAITSLDGGHRVYQALAGDLDTMAEVLALTPAKAAVRLAKIDSELSAGSRRTASKLPPPISPLNGASRPDSTIYDPKQSIEDFMRLRDKQVAERRSRR